jgi:hypothetical protein
MPKSRNGSGNIFRVLNKQTHRRIPEPIAIEEARQNDSDLSPVAFGAESQSHPTSQILDIEGDRLIAEMDDREGR